MKNNYIDQILSFFNKVDDKVLVPTFEHPDMKLLSGDASSRLYWRYMNLGQSYIVCLYPDLPSKASLERFIYWQKKYKEIGISVPNIIHVDLLKQIVIQEDVGDEFLQKTLGTGSIELEYDLLKSALSMLHKVRKINYQDYNGVIPKFNAEKLTLEVNQTHKYFVKDYLGQNIIPLSKLEDAWIPIITKLEKLPQVLCHRDFHSRNLMYFNKQLHAIDFQDTMLGSIYYDLCSLMDDCYLRYHPATYQKLMREYYDSCIQEGVLRSSFDEYFVNYHFMKLQRQYKAIGSFTYVWKEKCNTRYLKYIAYVMESMKTSFEVLDLPEINNLKKILLGIYYEY